MNEKVSDRRRPASSYDCATYHSLAHMAARRSPPLMPWRYPTGELSALGRRRSPPVVSRQYAGRRCRITAFNGVWRAGANRHMIARMSLRSGIYIVPTQRWYVERTVWLIAGVVLLMSTALAALVNPFFVLLVIATGLASITVALTGFCVVGNVLHRLGFPSMLGDAKPRRGNLYFMQTDSWYLERRIYLTVGINLTIAAALSLVHNVWWLAFTGFVGCAMLWFAATGFCIMANGLYWLGAEPRLAPEKAAECPVAQAAGEAVRT